MLSQCLVPSITKSVVSFMLVLGQQPLSIQNLIRMLHVKIYYICKFYVKITSCKIQVNTKYCNLIKDFPSQTLKLLRVKILHWMLKKPLGATEN